MPRLHRLVPFALVLALLSACGGGGGSGSGGGGTPPEPPAPRGVGEPLDEQTHLDASAYEVFTATSGSDGRARAFSARLGAEVALDLTDPDGAPLEGIRVDFATLADRVLAWVEDPSGQYEGTVFEADVHDELFAIGALHAASADRRIIVLPLVLGLIKLVAVASALKATLEVAEGVQHLYDFHVEHPASFDGLTVTYSATLGEIAAFIEADLDIQLGLLELATAHLGGGVIRALKPALIKLGQEVGEVVLGEVLPGLIAQAFLGPSAMLSPDTPAYLKVSVPAVLLPTSGLRRYEIIPLLDTEPLRPQAMSGRWRGGWNNLLLGLRDDAILDLSAAADGTITGTVHYVDDPAPSQANVTGALRRPGAGPQQRVEIAFDDPRFEGRRVVASAWMTGDELLFNWTANNGQAGTGVFERAGQLVAPPPSGGIVLMLSTQGPLPHDTFYAGVGASVTLLSDYPTAAQLAQAKLLHVLDYRVATPEQRATIAAWVAQGGRVCFEGAAGWYFGGASPSLEMDPLLGGSYANGQGAIELGTPGPVPTALGAGAYLDVGGPASAAHRVGTGGAVALTLWRDAPPLAETSWRPFGAGDAVMIATGPGWGPGHDTWWGDVVSYLLR